MTFEGKTNCFWDEWAVFTAGNRRGARTPVPWNLEPDPWNLWNLWNDYPGKCDPRRDAPETETVGALQIKMIRR